MGSMGEQQEHVAARAKKLLLKEDQEKESKSTAVQRAPSEQSPLALVVLTGAVLTLTRGFCSSMINSIPKEEPAENIRMMSSASWVVCLLGTNSTR